MSELPEGWVMVKVAEVGSVSLGRQRAPKYHQGSAMRPYLRVANVFEDRIDTSDVMEMHFSDEEFERYRLTPGDILLNEGQSPHLLGRPAVYRGDPPNVAFTNSLIRFRAGPAISPEWALAVFRHYMHSKRFMQESRITTNIAHLSASRFAEVEFPIPPLPEQERLTAAIEEQLSRLDAGLVALERAKQNLKRMRAAVLITAMSGRLAEANSDQWEFVPLGQLLLDIHAGKSFRCEERPAGPDEWGVIKVSAMTWGEFRPNENKTVLVGREVDTRMEIRPGDLLVSRANTVDYVGAVVHVRGCRPRLLLSDKSLRLTPGPRVLPEWLVAVLRSPMSRGYLELVATGTSDSMRNISQPKLRSLIVPVPPISMQKRLTDEVERQMSLIAKLDSEVAERRKSAECLRSSILAAAISGKLVPQDPNDEPASVLLERVTAERASSAVQKPTRARSQRRRMITA